MPSSIPPEATLRQFVLGSLDDQRRLEIEERLVTDPEAFDALELVEEELVDQYADDLLSSGDRRDFERSFLTTPERRRQVAFVRLLREQAARASGPRVSSRRTSFGSFSAAWAAPLAASLCVAVGLSAWLLVRQASLIGEIHRLDARRASQEQAASRLSGELNALSARTQQLETTLLRERGGIPDAGPAARGQMSLSAPPQVIELMAGRLRDGGTLTRVVPDAAVVHFRLVLRGPEYSSYRAVLYNANGDELWSMSKLAPVAAGGSGSVIVVAPSELLVRDDYEIRLRGITAAGREEAVATYVFRRP